MGNYSLDMTLVFKACRSFPHSSWPAPSMGGTSSCTHQLSTAQVSLAGSCWALCVFLLCLEVKLCVVHLWSGPQGDGAGTLPMVVAPVGGWWCTPL